MKIQATKPISAIELENGYEADFDTTHKYCVGFALICANSSNTILYDGSIVGLRIDAKEIFPDFTPLSLFQTNSIVAPNDRFFEFKRIDIYKKKFQVKLVQEPALNNPYIILFLLANDTDFQ